MKPKKRDIVALMYDVPSVLTRKRKEAMEGRHGKKIKAIMGRVRRVYPGSGQVAVKWMGGKAERVDTADVRVMKRKGDG